MPVTHSLAHSLIDRKEDPYVEKLAQLVPEEELYKFYHCRPTYKTVMKSFKRYCQNPIPEPFTPVEIEAGNRMLDHCFGHLRGTCEPWSMERVEWEMPLLSSPGTLWKNAGFKTKAAALAACRRLILWFIENCERLDLPVVWSVSGKAEMLSILKLLEEKIRTFVVCPVEFYVLQAMLYGEMNERIKVACDEAPLRFCAWFGGMHRLAQRLNRLRHKFAGDITGMDRCYPAALFRAWYAYRLKLMKVADPRAHFVENRVIRSLCLLPDGSVWLKEWGNPSGHFSTTTDSSGGHIFIMGVLVYELLQEMPPSKNIDVALYSDDHVGSCAKVLPFTERSKVYARFGFELKEADDVVTEDVQDLTFLGFRFQICDQKYVPVFDRVKVANALLRPGRKVTPKIQNERLYGFLCLTIHDPVFAQFIWGEYLQHCHDNHFEPHIKSLSQLRRLMLGQEVFEFSS
jgi:hypothetical protein